MAKPDYVPRTHAGFNSWQKTVAEHVAAHAASWGIPNDLTSEVATRHAMFGPLFIAIDNLNTRTLQQVSAFNSYRIGYTEFLRQLVQGHLVNNTLVPYDMKIAMGLNPRSNARPERPTINSHPTLGYKSFGGAKVRFECTDSEDGRKARPANSDGVELYITVEGAKPAPGQLGPDPQQPVALNTETTVQSSKARFIYKFKLEDRGKQFTVYARWYNNNDRAKDGEVGPVLTGFIS